MSDGKNMGVPPSGSGHSCSASSQSALSRPKESVPNAGLLDVLLGMAASCDGQLYLYQPEMHEAAHWLRIFATHLRSTIRMARAYGRDTGTIFEGALASAERALASGMSALGQDPQGLEAKPVSPTAEGGDAQKPGEHP